jgi:hypothetical protein
MASLLPSNAQAGLVTVWVTNQTTAAGSSGAFDLLLQNNTDIDVDISAFDAILEVALNSGLTFTGVDALTSSPYIFGTVQTEPLGSILNPPVTVSLSDDKGAGSQTVTPGQTVGLGHIYYTLDPSTPTGTIDVLFALNSPNIYDSIPSPITPLDVTGGVITVSGTAVPEPSTFVLVGAACAIAGIRSLRRRKAAAQ